MAGTEISEVSKLEGEEARIEKAKELLDNLQKIPAESVLCMMGIVVHTNGEVRVISADEEEHDVKVHGFVLGDDSDIAKMFSTLVTMTRSGLVQANSPPDTSSEVKH